MSEAQGVPQVPAKPASHRRLVLLLVGAILLGSLYGIYRVVTWNPNYITNVIQANTLILKSDEGVILIGVDCPPAMEERVGPPSVEFVRKCVLHREVRIEPGEDPKDDAGWILGYVFYTEGGREHFLNEELLRRGFARVGLRFPNLKYRKVFEAAEAEAKGKKLGVWAPGYQFPGR